MRCWIAAAIGVAMLALGACSATAPVQARGEPVLRFSAPDDATGGTRDGRCGPARVRRDAHGRQIYFREVPLDRHGTARAARDPACDDRGGGAGGDGAGDSGRR